VTDYLDYEVGLAPPYLQGFWGRRWLGAFGYLKDTIIDGCKQAIKARFVKIAPEDAVPFIGAERGIERAPNEAFGSYKTRVENAWDIWLHAGSSEAHVNALSAFGVSRSAVWVFNTHSGFAWDSNTYWSRLWIVITAGGHPWTQELWNDGGIWDDTGTWDTTATVGEVAAIRRAVRQFKSGQTYPVALFVALSGDVWGPGFWDEPGTWDTTAGKVAMWLLGHTWGEEAHWGGSGGTWNDAGTYDSIIEG
jgi:hypothetical protein